MDKTLSMSKQFPFVLLIKMIAYYDYKSGTFQSKGMNITANRICKELGVNSTVFTKAMETLEEYDLCGIVEKFGQKVVMFNLDIVRGITNAKIKKANLK